MSLSKKPRRRSGGKPLALLTLTPIMGAILAGSALAASAPKITAKSKFDLSGKLNVTGKVAGVAAGSQVAIYDAADHSVLYSTKTNSKLAFNITVPADKASLCQVLIESGSAKTVFPVTGASGSCKTAPICNIVGGDQSLSEGASATFTTSTGKAAKAATSFTWTISDQAQLKNDGDWKTSGSGNSITHSFPHAGLYRIDLQGSNGSGTCGDDVVVSVAPKSSVVPSGKVPESAKAADGSALQAATGSYVVLPFEETGMQGGGQVHLPYNVMIPYNALNAQVIKKEAHKPPLVSTGLDVFYSAASNPKDPLAPGSINSTSQNWFSDQKSGANVDLSKSAVSPSTLAPTSNVFITGHDFVDAVIRKSEQWDRMYDKNAAARGAQQTSYDFAWQQNRFTPAKPMANPDEGIRGNLDMGNGVRSMPGKLDPYHVNDPQPFDANPDQSAFTAQFIPASNTDDKGRINPYPLMRVEAKVGGQTVAKADAVYSTASETRCRECHLPGGVAADEDVWRTPVTEAELKLADGKPGPATGAGSFDPGLDATKAWPPAVHNRFDDKQPDNPTFTNLIDPKTGVTVPKDGNGLRLDRVKASRWVKLDGSGKPTSEIQTTKPADALCSFNTTDPGKSVGTNCWTVQLQINFKSGADFGDANDPISQERAAIYNTLIMHDYMVFYGPTPATGKTWPASYSTQLADAYGQDDVGKANANPMYFCSGHHQSQLKFDVGIAAKAPATNRSDYSRAFHAFHGKMQSYKTDVSASDSADGKTHNKGELIRDSRGHPLMYGGRGWDSQKDDDNGLPLKLQSDKTFADNSILKDKDGKATDYTKWDATKFTVPTWDPAKNNWRPDLWSKHSKGDLLLQFGDDVAMEENCVTCHTGKTEKAYRDIHHAAGLKCDNCHGDMLAVGNVFPNEGYDANLTWAGAFGKDTNNGYGNDPVANLLKSEPADFRRPWLDEPDCGSCHMGDAMYADFSAGTMKQAWDSSDKTGFSRMPMNARFAVMPHKEDRLEKYTLTAADETAGKGKAGDTSYKAQSLSQVLYRKSGDVHGSGANGDLTCSTCHGGSHAIWPNPDPNANDNVTAKQLQGYDGNIAECSVCHVKEDFVTGLVATTGGASGLGVGQGVRDGTVVAPNIDDKAQKAFLAGPHGMHPVNDESWWKNANGPKVDDFVSKVGNGGWHSDMAYKPGPDGEDQCAACHGADHKGTRLSKTLTARTFVSDKGKTIKVEAGQPIGCDLCHKMEVSFKRSPDSKKADGGWPKAKTHMPPMPEAISPSGTTGGGGGGHG